MRPYQAYELGLKEGPNDKTRATASEHPLYAIWYARDVDQGPHVVTRAGACKDPSGALRYALSVDHGPHDDTRAAAVKDLGCMDLYKKFVEEKSEIGPCYFTVDGS